MKRQIVALIAILVASQAALCRPNTPQPPLPQLRTVTVIVRELGLDTAGPPVQGAAVTGLRRDHVELTNSEGLAITVDVSADLHQAEIGVSIARCKPFARSMAIPDGFATVPVFLDCFQPPVPVVSAGERFQIHAQGPVFLRSDATRYLWNGASDFALFQRFQRGEDVDPILTQRIKAGFTLLRVFGMYEHGIADASGLPVFRAQDVPDYLSTLQRFVDKLAGRGLRVEFTVFADAQILMPAQADQQRHLDSVFAAIGDRWNVNFELANEPFKNGVDVETLRVPAGVVYATGSYDIDGKASIRVGTYFNVHTDRKIDWPRTARALAELFGKLTWANGVEWQGTNAPVVGDEPTGFAEAKDGDRRSESADEAAWYAGITVMFGAGSTFHSDGGIRSQLWGPKQLAAANAWNWAMRWVPADAVFAPYQRGAEFGGAGIGNMPLQHLDTWASRTYCKQVGAFEYCIASQPTNLWKAEPLRGCTIVEQPRLGFVKLSCPSPFTVH